MSALDGSESNGSPGTAQGAPTIVSGSAVPNDRRITSRRM
jgi:hypothetical protein